MSRSFLIFLTSDKMLIVNELQVNSPGEMRFRNFAHKNATIASNYMKLQALFLSQV